jgi:hypothetical protein
MVGAITAGLGLATQLGGAIWGGIKSSQSAQKARDLISQQRNENKKWYEQKMAEDYLQRSDVQNVLRKQKELLSEQMKRARATNVVAGGTDESLALQQQAAMESVGDTTANIAANASASKDAAEQQYRATNAALDQQEIGVYNNEAQQITNAAGQLTQTGANMVSAGLRASDLGGTSKTLDVGGSPVKANNVDLGGNTTYASYAENDAKSKIAGGAAPLDFPLKSKN